jgi:hypothetical protein
MGTNPGCPYLVWESNKHHLNKRKMKKLNLEKLKLAAEDVLQRNQLAGIYGGSDGPCVHSLTCNDGTQISGRTGPCPSSSGGGCVNNGGIDQCSQAGC